MKAGRQAGRKEGRKEGKEKRTGAAAKENEATFVEGRDWERGGKKGRKEGR